MASTIVHFGRDECARIRVLESVGYTVLDCGCSSRRLRKGLRVPHEAIAVTENSPIVESDVLPLLGSEPAPLILFASLDHFLEPTLFDLVIPPLTHPQCWVERINTLLQGSKSLREESRAICAASVELRNSSKALREEARHQREVYQNIRRNGKRD